MNFRRRFTFMLFLGVSFSVTLWATVQSLFFGAIIAMVAVVLNYWLVMIFVRRTIMEGFATAASPE